MEFNSAISKVENLLSENKMNVLSIIDLRRLTATSEIDELPSGKYIICDVRVAIPISQDG